jgi:hypothetical protein
MLEYESRDACISVCMVAKSSIHHLCRPIPSVEFSTTNSLKDEGKLFVHSNPLEQVHIIYTGVTKLSLAVTPTFCKNKNFCANRSIYKIIVLVKNFPKINLA